MDAAERDSRGRDAEGNGKGEDLGFEDPLRTHQGNSLALEAESLAEHLVGQLACCGRGRNSSRNDTRGSRGRAEPGELRRLPKGDLTTAYIVVTM